LYLAYTSQRTGMSDQDIGFDVLSDKKAGYEHVNESLKCHVRSIDG